MGFAPTENQRLCTAHITSITDGTSNTLIVGPRPAVKSGSWGWCLSTYFGDNAMAVNATSNIFYSGSLGACPTSNNWGPGNFTNDCDFNHFWSPFPSGGNWVFSDGSVRFVTYSASSIMQPLATIAGGENVDMSLIPQ
ncbi:MAG: DUF1559 domain-containing protein [Gemmataceae bacterium]|nr:DUF1559 domain-containing protein [Gemmataceae bacterium]